MLRHFLRNLFRRDRVERELSDEIDGVVELMIEEKVAQGMSQDEARRAARLELGRVEHVKDNVRDVRAGVWLDALRQDVRFGVRTMLRRPGFAAIAVLTLGVGMGATTAIFSLVDSVLLKPLPFHEPDRLTTGVGGASPFQPAANRSVAVELSRLGTADAGLQKPGCLRHHIRQPDGLRNAGTVGGHAGDAAISFRLWASSRSSAAGSRRPKAPRDRPGSRF